MLSNISLLNIISQEIIIKPGIRLIGIITSMMPVPVSCTPEPMEKSVSWSTELC